jgi:hypothetical protein
MGCTRLWPLGKTVCSVRREPPFSESWQVPSQTAMPYSQCQSYVQALPWRAGLASSTKSNGSRGGEGSADGPDEHSATIEACMLTLPSICFSPDSTLLQMPPMYRSANLRQRARHSGLSVAGRALAAQQYPPNSRLGEGL